MCVCVCVWSVCECVSACVCVCVRVCMFHVQTTMLSYSVEKLSIVDLDNDQPQSYCHVSPICTCMYSVIS